MDNERIRSICMALPHVTETVNWGHHLVYWVGDRERGGRMFALTDLDGSGEGVLTFHCGPERFHELLEIDGIRPAPYSAKNFWVTLERWDALSPRQIEDELKRAHDLIFARLPARLRAVLTQPEPTRGSAVRKKTTPPPARARTSPLKSSRASSSRANLSRAKGKP